MAVPWPSGRLWDSQLLSQSHPDAHGTVNFTAQSHPDAHGTVCHTFGIAVDGHENAYESEQKIGAGCEYTTSYSCFINCLSDCKTDHTNKITCSRLLVLQVEWTIKWCWTKINILYQPPPMFPNKRVPPLWNSQYIPLVPPISYIERVYQMENNNSHPSIQTWVLPNSTETGWKPR